MKVDRDFWDPRCLMYHLAQVEFKLSQEIELFREHKLPTGGVVFIPEWMRI